MKIKRITKVDPRVVYAMQTSTGTFIADGLAHHNCYGCNMMMSGNSHIFRENLVKEIGEKRVRNIEKGSKRLFKEKDDYIIDIINEYQRKIRQIINT